MEGYCRTLTIKSDGSEVSYYFGLDFIRYERGRYHVLLSAPSLTGNWRLISWYTRWMNRNCLSPVHFADIVEDILYDDRTGRSVDLD